MANYDSIYDMPDADLSCPCCRAPEEELIDDEETGETFCPNCCITTNWAHENIGKLWEPLPDNYYDRTCCHCHKTFSNRDDVQYIPYFDGYRVACFEHTGVVKKETELELLAYHRKVDDLADIEDFNREEEERRYKELGWIDENGEYTSEYEHMADLAYDAAREKRMR